jgi:HD-GYP domain-containing protein (c-di-GMP phosphodiesterase class II)
MNQTKKPQDLIKRLLRIGTALSSERDIDALLEMILVESQDIVNADGGTLYRVTDEKTLKFEILRNTSLSLASGGKSGGAISLPPMPLFEANGEPVLSKVATYCVHQGETINIPDAYHQRQFDLSGTHAMDASLGYRSQSILAVPMKNHEGEIIGVLQLINALDPISKTPIAFTDDDQSILESLASLAAIALTNRMLILHLEKLFESFISMINHAIDDKSPYTAGHCGRVPELTMLLAEAVNRVNYGPLKDFSMTDRDAYELKIAGLLHDCGKITTPVHVVDKATKLETLFDRIHLVNTRFEVVRRDLDLKHLRGEITSKELEESLKRLEDDRAFIEKANIGSEFMQDADVERIANISKRYRWTNRHGDVVDFFSSDEIKNLTIRAGTLTNEEREIINHHIDVTIDMLEKLPWPKHLRNVPEYAGGHHERMDGKGYPKGLTRDQMSVQARCMGIADIFEALTARDRPYKKGKTLRESLEILGKMKLGHHIDPDLFNVFIWERVYEQYAHRFLDSSQIDNFDVTAIPGYEPPPVQ